MHISTKISIAIGIVSFAVFGSYGLWQIQQETHDLQLATEKELSLLGTATHVGVENALRDHQIADITETLQSLELTDPNIHVFVFSPQKSITATPNQRSIFTQQAMRLAKRSEIQQNALVFIDTEHAPAFAGFASPLRLNAQQFVGTLVLIKPLSELEHDLKRTTRSIVLSLFILLICVTTSVVFFGKIYIRKPMAHMIEGMRKAQTGDLSQKIHIQQHDEIAEASQEFNTLLQALQEAKQRATRESEHRRELEEGLQRVNRLVSIGQMAAGLAHEIGSPLQIIHGRAQALLERNDLPQDVLKNARIFSEQTERITRIIEQLLHITRRTPTRFTDKLKIQHIVLSVVELFDILARKKQITLHQHVNLNTPPITGDPDKLQQLVFNLINNAIQATPAKGNIFVQLYPTQYLDKNVIALSVSDTGIGIPENQQEHIFEPFFTTHAHEGGTGLGLAIVQSIVLEHQASIHVESVMHTGTTFTVYFPLNVSGSVS